MSTDDALIRRAEQSIDDLLRLINACETASMAWHVQQACPSCVKMFQARDAIRDLLAAVRAREGWQPMATAPKDGTPVLLWWPYWANVRPLVGWWQNNGGWQSWEASDEDAKPPTHWRPLPSPPDGAQEGQ